MGEFEAIYYNPDSNAGGQFVVLHIPYELIAEAKENSNSVNGFYEYIDSKAYTELIDVGTQEFSDYLEAYAEPESDYIGRTEETMQALISQAERVLKNDGKDVSYSAIKAANENAIVLYQVGDFFELYGNDATYISDTFALNLMNKTVDGELVSMCRIPSDQLETYLNMLTDRGNDVAVASLGNGEHVVYTVVSTNKEDPVQSQPVGRIEYLDDNGDVIHTDEYTSEYQFKKDIEEESSFGTRLRFYIYRNADGKTIDQSFITKLDTPLNVYEIIDSTYPAQAQQIEETHTEETKPEPLMPSFEKPKRTRVQTFDLHPDIPMSERHTFDLASHEVEEVGKKERFRRNLMAIQLLKKCQDENRFATPDEQEILSKYVGWGGIPEAFDENNSSWTTEFLELSAVLTPDEYESAKASVLTAFYTPPAVISSIYKAMEQMGFREGNILEPSCGIGNFIGMLPESMKEAKMYGVEIDKISAGIAQQLYQKTSIAAQPFEEANVPDSFFDAVSYTHLDVYKRQIIRSGMWISTGI